MCLSGVTCLFRTVVSLSLDYKNPTHRLGLQRGHHHYHPIKI